MSKRNQRLARRGFRKNQGASWKNKNKIDSNKKEELICYECKKLGHFKSECPLLKDETPKKNKKSKKAMVAAAWSDSDTSSSETDDEKSEERANICLMAQEDETEETCSRAQLKKKQPWYLDSGCSRHMTGHEMLFALLDKRKRGTVSFGDDSKGRIHGIVEKGYDRGNIDTTLFIKKYLNDLIIVQIYVDDIIFGATNEALCKNFAKEMQGEFEMSMMRELRYFLGLQIKQSHEGIFINQERYAQEIRYAEAEINFNTHESINQTRLRWKRFQSQPKETHLTDVKRIFRYLIDTQGLGIWYSRKSTLSLVGYSNADFAGSKTDRKSISGTCQYLGRMLVSWSSKKQNSMTLSTAEPEYVSLANIQGRSGNLSYISLQDLWLMEHAFNEKKGIWAKRYDMDLVKTRDQAIYYGSLVKIGYILDGKRFIKTPKTSPRKEHSLPVKPEEAPSRFSNEEIFNLLMMIDGKLTDQGEKIQKIEEKITELENKLKEKENMPSELVAADSSATSNIAPAQQGDKGSVEAVEKSAPYVESCGIQAKEQGTKVVGSETKKQQTSPPNSEEFSIMDIFHQMIKEGQGEKDTARTETQKDGEDVGKGKKSASATRVKAKEEKAKATVAPPTEAKSPTKGRKTMATKTTFLKRRKSSKLVEKSRPVSTSSPQSPIPVSNKSSLEPSSRQSSPL
ncbi:zinc finger protein [Theobroma cacao]|nr:zinc finger protein [Theobroma cacao]